MTLKKVVKKQTLSPHPLISDVVFCDFCQRHNVIEIITFRYQFYHFCSQEWGNIIMANVKALNCWSNTFIFISSDKNCHFIHQHYIKQRVYHIDLCWSRSQREIISKSPISSHPLHCRRLPQKALHIYAWCIFSTFLYFSPAALHIYTQSGCVC